MSRKRWFFLAILVALIAIQLIPVERSNPPTSGEIDAPPAIAAILEQSCYDCHSGQTRWPWYSRVAPVSWMIANHVKEGREHLNFTSWDSITPAAIPAILHEIQEEVDEGKMPPSGYVMIHKGAALDEDDLRILREWTGGGH